MNRVSLRLLVVLTVIDFIAILLFTFLWLFDMLSLINFFANAGSHTIILIILLVLIFFKLRSGKKTKEN